MVTTSHGILAYLFHRFVNRKLKTRVPSLYILIGAMLPDTFHVTNAILGWLSFRFFGQRWHQEWLIELSKLMHSITVCSIAFFLFFFLFLVFAKPKAAYGRAAAFFLGWGIFHIVVDVLTHLQQSWPYLWPWTKIPIPWVNIPIHGLIDHNYPLMLAIEFILSIALGIFLLIRYFWRRKK